ncbi:MAG: HAMP domain-containing protein [Gemmatimonadaceae bacterium]|nr:HAMP domain-containing protein [Gemmatimonadaceae bacterium]
MKLVHRLLLYSFTVIAVLILVVVVILDRRLHSRIADESLAELAREARLVAVQWKSQADPDELADEAGKALGHRVTLISPSGVVVGDSEFDGAALRKLANHATRPEVIEAASGGVGSARRVSPSKGDEEVYVAVPAAAGTARVSVETHALDAIFDRARKDVVTAGLAALVLAILLSVFFARNVSRPVTQLRDVARAMADHDFNRPMVKAPGEVGELSATLHQLGGQIEGLEKMRRDFVANVSHELRTPLTILGGFAETLVDDDPPPEIRKEFAGMILSNARRMQRIVDELLDLSRIESGGWVPRPTIIDLHAAANEVILAINPAAAKKNLTLELDIAADAAEIYADRTALRQILSNLVENAVRHTATGSVTIFSHREPGGIALGVKDTGEGIAAAHLPRVFERFYRADPGRSREQGGTGLGLAIVRHMAEAHGGRVRAESTPEKGTTITALFPPSLEGLQIGLPGL